MTQGELDQGRRVTALTKLHNRGATLNGFSSSAPDSSHSVLFFGFFFVDLYSPLQRGSLAFENSRCGNEQREKKKKSPQGYDEDNASLDKFCKIKAKEKHKVDQLNCGENSTTRVPGFDIIHNLACRP